MDEEAVETAAVETQAATPDQSTNQVEATQTETPEVEDYSWVPKKYIVDGKPDFQNLANGYTNLEKKLGTKGAFAPESPDEYSYTPTSIELDPESTAAFKQEALAAGLSTKQYEFIMQKYEQEITNMVGTVETSEKQLRADWGNAFDENLSAAQKAFQAYAPSDVSIEDPVFNNPAVLKLLARLGADLSEDTPPNHASSSAGLSETDIDAIMASPDYYNDLAKQQKVSKWFESQYK